MLARRHWLLVLLVLLTKIVVASGQEPKRPNILFAIADDWSYGHAGAYGCRWINTPGFDRVARQGLLFRNAYTPNAKCAPSRACILTGRNSWQLKAAANHICAFPTEFKTYAEALSQHGYYVGTTGKGWGPGTAFDKNGKRRLMTGKPFNKRKAKPPARAISNNDYAANFGDFLERAPKGEPWCFWFGTTEPHRGYEYGVGVAKGGKKLSDIDRVPAFWKDTEVVRNDMLDYGFEVEHFDNHLVRILKQIEERGELENTLVVVTSDHGMPFPRCKGQAYDFSNHVPLAIMWPKGISNSGLVLTDYVSFIDVVPTFLEVAGLDTATAGMAPSSGKSWTDLFAAEKSGQVNPTRDHVLIGKERHDIGRPNDWGYPIRGIVKDGMLFIRNYKVDRWPACNPETGYLNCDGSPTKTQILKGRMDSADKNFWQLCFGKRPEEELFNLRNDIDCVKNLAQASQFLELKEKLEQQMIKELEQQQDPRMFGKGDYFDNIPYVNAGTRKFYERYMNGEKLKAGWVNPTDFDKRK